MSLGPTRHNIGQQDSFHNEAKGDLPVALDLGLVLTALTVLVSATMTLNAPPVGIGSFRLRDTDGVWVLIKTNRFLLREFTTEDTPAFVAYHRDPRYMALHGPEEAEPNHLNHLVETFMAWALEQSRLNYQLAVCHKSRLTPLVGCAGLRRAGYPEGEAELGIELGPDVWGRYRYAVEITQAVLELGFRHLRLERIVGVTLSANEPVRRLAEWFGASVVETRPGPKWAQ